MIPEPVAVTLLVCTALERLNVPYLVGGSFASTIHGQLRTTLDSDLVADLRSEQVRQFVQELEAEFYIDEEMIRKAIASRGCFNVIHLQTMFKVDVFIPKHRAFDQEQMRRRKRTVMAYEPECTMYIATAEDTILAKLEWYQLGKSISERQWRDVLGIIKLQNTRLDMEYVRRWAAELGVADLLTRAMREARSIY